MKTKAEELEGKINALYEKVAPAPAEVDPNDPNFDPSAGTTTEPQFSKEQQVQLDGWQEQLDKIYAKMDDFGADINALNDKNAKEQKDAREKAEAGKSAKAEIEAKKKAKAKARADKKAKEKKEREAKERAEKAMIIKRAEEQAAWELKRQQQALAETVDPEKLKAIKIKILQKKVEVKLQQKEKFYADWEAKEQEKINNMYQKRADDMNKFWEKSNTMMNRLWEQ